MSAVAALLNGNTNTNDDSVEQLQKQIEILKKVIHDKNVCSKSMSISIYINIQTYI